MRIEGRWFLDDKGRRVWLRGINLGGGNKHPYRWDPLTPAHERKDGISFVGRPFPLADADEHLGRLRHWGFNCLRLLTTWEAIEPDAPGRYDTAYLEYFTEVVRRAGDYGFSVFVDPHQDAWSRVSGGDGAPTWTLEKVGFDVTALDASDAAITWSGRHPRYGTMVWPNNWGRLASATMYTLFFAGNRFAPACEVDGRPVQEFLQSHFIGAMRALAERLAGFPHVLGYDSLNEPSAGYAGLASLSTPLGVYNSAPRLTGFESLFVPAGFPADVPFVERRGLEQAPNGTARLNPNGRSAWTEPTRDVWRRHGVWDVDASGRPRLLRDDYFAGVSFFEECLRPFARRYADALTAVHPGAALFIEGEPGSREGLRWDGTASVVNASHWYDLFTLITKTYDPAKAIAWGTGDTVTGRDEVRRSFARQIGAHVEESDRRLGGAPTLIGEFGLAMDIDGGRAFRDGDFSAHDEALASYYDALDENLAHSALWNYTEDNTNRWGDGWNEEDLSIYSRDQRKDPGDPDSGGRGTRGFCRPTVVAAAGTPKRQSFDFRAGEFFVDIDVDLPDTETLLYVPRLQYPSGFTTDASHGTLEPTEDPQRWRWRHAGYRGRQTLALRRLLR